MPLTRNSPTDRKALLRSIGEAYFEGLTTGDVSRVPYVDDIVLHMPFAPGGEECPIVGRRAVLEFFAGVYETISATQVKDYYFNETLSAVCVQAEIELRTTRKILRVANVFNVDKHGRVIAQHNHCDPVCGDWLRLPGSYYSFSV